MLNENEKFKQTYETEENKRKKQIVSKISFLIFVICLIFFVPNVIFYSCFCSLKVLGVSMKPTLNKNLAEGMSNEEYSRSIYQDMVIISKFDKGDVGDIVVVQKNGSYIVKRLIAKGGQKVTLKKVAGTNLYEYYVDGVRLSEPYIAENYLEMGDIYFLTFRTIATEKGTEEASLTVPEGQIFVLGDNRGVSEDSHIYGCLDEENIFGKAVVYYSYDTNFFKYVFDLIFK